MPSQYDNSYHYDYSKPTYDSENDKIKYETMRESDYVFERSTPQEPNRE